MSKNLNLDEQEREQEKEINTILAEDIKFNGTLKFSTSLKIKGEFEGEIDSTGHLVIGKNANVKANIKAKKVTVYGKITGNIEVSEKIEIFSGGSVYGDIKTPDLFIQSGCIFNGNCVMTSKEKLETHTPTIKQEKIKK
jgi:cytoskeletal protein CcmA (bactofilin family)